MEYISQENVAFFKFYFLTFYASSTQTSLWRTGNLTYVTNLAKESRPMKTGGNLPQHLNSHLGYEYSDIALKDATNALEKYPTLKPNVKHFAGTHGQNRELVCLEGTIPVYYRGFTYNFPICLWLQEKHPNAPPFAYVVPTAEMEIKPGLHVDAQGRVYLPFLTEWKHPQSDIYGLIEVLRQVFSEEPPVYGRKPTPALTSSPSSHPLTKNSSPEYIQARKLIRKFVLLVLFRRPALRYPKYLEADLALRDAKSALEQHRNLKPYIKQFAYPGGLIKELVCLEGTISINYKGCDYNIPICLWLQEKHPNAPPFAYVVPTAEMEIKSGRHVDAQGRVYLLFLTEWRKHTKNPS
ncbi:uncharacterized protein LOC114523108 [Dendronephthya gigantea]|uniref:uncharacterized protein LOC114523108 n=1 Tax=Dendronephthya gigantea TaxID=151771 RepID=UPI00106B813D|nr:uncharacterized protein LOC114523108 [Dendronephthya gigantea]